MSIRLLSSDTLPVTIEQAIRFRDMKASRVERPFDKSRVEYLRRKYDAGLFFTPHWAVAILDGVEQRINGQHSSNMLADLNGNFAEGTKAHIDTFEVESEKDIVLLFRQLDNRKNSRSPTDVAGAYLGVVDDLAGIDRKVAKKLAEGVAWYYNTIEDVDAGGGDDRYELLYRKDLHPFYLWLNGVLTSKTDELKKPPVIAAIYACTLADESDGRAFWEKVATATPLGEEDDVADPADVLDDWLRLPKEKGVTRSDYEAWNGCVFAWNAHRKGKKLGTIRASAKTITTKVNAD